MKIHRHPKDTMTPTTRCLVAVTHVATTAIAGAADGLIEMSPHNAKTTMDKFEAVAKERGLNVFARIDHAAGAQKVGKTLRPTEVLIFGNPQGDGMRTVGRHRPAAEGLGLG